MKKRTIIIGIFILFLVGVISIIGTYAIDSTITEGNSSTADYLFNITLGDRTNREVVIPSYDSKIVDIKISNPNEFNMSYLLYIEGVNSNISVINIKDTEASGVLASKTVGIIQVFIQNNSSSDITIKIKDIVGFAKETLTLPSNSTAINKGNYYKAIVKPNNKSYGKVKQNVKLSTMNGIVKYEIIPNTGYKYKSTTCNGSIANNILTISNITNNINCEVVFEPNTYTIVYAGNGNTGGSTATQTCTYDSTCTIASNGFTKTGYTFNKWSDSTGVTSWTGWSGTWKYVNGQYGITNNTLTLTAQWTTNSYSISYSLNNGTKGSSAPTSGTYDSVLTINNPTKTVTVTGNANGTGATVGSATSKAQTFAGWTASNLNTSTAYYGTSSSAVSTKWSSGSTKVTAQYFKNLTPTNGATVALTANWTAVAFNLPTVTKTGYTCKWNTKSDGSGSSYNSGASYTPSATGSTSITMYAVCSLPSLYEIIKNNADTTTQIDFSKTSTIDKTNGIYTTTNTENGVPVYYYRGAVDNNHVLFANLCWEIIRTTETGGVKLIYDGVPSNGTCANTGASSYLLDDSKFNSGYFSPAYVGYMYGSVYTANSKKMSSLSGNIVYGNDINYDTVTGKYTLVGTITKDVADWGADYTTIGSKYHYTCFTSSNTCTQVNYMHYSDSSSSYYFILTDGKKQIDILDEMLNNNTNESTAKKAIDLWYSSNMTSYISQLEDTIFCNDRTISSYGGWDKDASNNSNYLYFGARGRLDSNKPSLICPRETDKFTVNGDNGNGTLTYPVGLISADEIAYAGVVYRSANASFYLYTGERYMWSLSPSDFGNYNAREFNLYSTGGFSVSSAYNTSGLRPSVSLKPGTVVVEGNGSSNSPYVI